MMFFTNWTMMVTALYFVIVMKASQPGASHGLLALHHILFEVSFIMNFVVVTVYWTMLH